MAAELRQVQQIAGRRIAPKKRLTSVAALQITILLLFVDGALRKWIAPPSLSTPLFLLKDVSFLLLIVAQNGVDVRRRRQGALLTLVAIFTAVYVLVQVASGRVSGGLAFAGLHADLTLPVLGWLCYQAGTSLTSMHARESLVRLCATLSVVTMFVVALQVISPSGAFVNKLFVSDGLDNLELPGEVVRATGPFTSAAGLSSGLLIFFVVALLSVFDWHTSRKVTFTLLGTTAVTMLLSGGRTSIFLLGAGLLLTAVPLAKAAKRNPAPALIFAVMVLTVVTLTLFPNYTTALGERFVTASQSENPITRIENYVFSWAHYLYNGTAFGRGVGTASNASVALTSIRADWIESDYSRYMFEFGAPVGLVCVLARYFLVLVLLRRAAQSSGHGLRGSFAGLVLTAIFIFLTNVSGQGDVSYAAAILIGVLAIRPDATAKSADVD